jgi:glutaredoxin
MENIHNFGRQRKMKKYVMICIVVLMMLVPMAGASNLLSTNKIEIKTPVSTNAEEFTHNVFVEYATTTTCGYCPTASSQLYSIYNSGDYDFYYVSLVANMNTKAYNRVKELGVTGVPDVYFDGEYKHVLGAQDDEQPYRNAIVQCGERAVPNIDIDANVEWKGGGTLKITVNVLNNEPTDYNGHLRVYVVEKESRWDDNGGNPYHFGVLDIPIDRSLSLISQPQQQGSPSPLGDTYTFRKTWFGALYGFGDITQNNILVVASVFDPDSGYAVQTAAAEPTSGGGSSVIISSQIQQLLPSIKILCNQMLLRVLSNH